MMHPEQKLCKYKTSLKFAGNNNHNTICKSGRIFLTQITEKMAKKSNYLNFLNNFVVIKIILWFNNVIIHL